MIAFLLNLPYTLVGIILAVLSIPYQISFDKKSFVLIVKIRKFWWVIGYTKNARAMTIGNVIMLGQRLLKNDLEHELIHVKQYQKYPIIFPVLYCLELFKNGYRQNKFEDEAFTLSNSIHEGGK